ncbi:hypothetical protein K9M42_02645 [Patescibacteria group bacterium]|nr:hypothetical protein [Patescibacteria group bacterium]
MFNIYFIEHVNEAKLVKGFEEHVYSIKNADIAVKVHEDFIKIGKIVDYVVTLNEKNIKSNNLEKEAEIIKKYYKK